jgi:sialate O-acetylesterase
MKNFLTLTALLFAFSLNAQLRLPALVSNGMVLQQNDSVNLWGWAGPGERIKVKTGWGTRVDSTFTSSGATWKLKIKTPIAGGPYTIEISTRSESITLSDVLIGEVWICSGQSNMEWSYLQGLKDIRAELPTCYNKNIRFFHIPKTTSAYPQDEVTATWEICDSTSIKKFSAVGYFFGKRINQQLNIPVGLINSSWGGTPAETWLPDAAVTSDPELKMAADKIRPFDWWPSKSGLAFNAMIAPVTNFNIAGALWYQGESNTGTNSTYQKLMTTLIDSWRKAWKKDFPFYLVQIAPFKYGNHNVGALVQEAQTKLMSHPKTGTVVITDLVDNITDIHPINKRDVGLRLANWALADTYGVKGIAYKSPQFKSMDVVKGKVNLSFSDAPNGLIAKNKVITGFFISGETEQWFPAEAKIVADGTGSKIILTSKSVKEPKHVRFGFGNTIIGNVFSKEGLPLTPFRTDNFVVDQSEVK